LQDLSPDANILFASESIVDILGYQPYEVIGRSCFDYFFVDDVPFARSEHRRSVRLDKAAVLYYARIRNSNNSWASCECVFTVVYDVLVACTSIYKGNLKSSRKPLVADHLCLPNTYIERVAEARTVRRMFSSPPRDPRYHMLQHLAPKFTVAPQPPTGEPRAALILNRFSRTLSIMYSTNAVADILGVSAEEMHGKSFYECIDESCLPDAIRCLESAKANDSIAYLRFIFRDPRRVEDFNQDPLEREASHVSSDSEDGGVQLGDHKGDESDVPMQDAKQNGSGHDQQRATTWTAQAQPNSDSSGSIASRNESRTRIFDTQPYTHSNPNSSTSSAPPLLASGEVNNERRAQPTPSHPFAPPREVEAVISCTSDGLVVIIRAAPYAPPPLASMYANGFFAAPWGANPIIPQNNYPPVNLGGPSADDFMRSIREVAVFAWALTGINGNIASYSRGTPRGEAAPAGGFPIWDPQQKNNHDLGPENQAAKKWARRERIEPPTLPLQLPFQHSQEEGRFANQNTIANNATTTRVLPAPVLTENGHTQYDTQYEHAQQQHVLPATSTTIEQNNGGLYLPNSNGNQGQGSSEGSHPVRYMWY
jgi:hypothetical protein